MPNQPGNSFTKQIPNILTIARLPIIAVFFAIILHAPNHPDADRSSLLLLAFILFLLAGIMDILDGHAARIYHATSKFGRIADPLVDKILVCGSFICFAIIAQPPLANLGISPNTAVIVRWTAVAILIARELIVTILRHTAEARGVSFPAIAAGKIKMFLQSFAIGAVIIRWAYVTRPWGDRFIAVTFIIMLTVTVVSGLLSLNRPRTAQAP